MEDKRKSAINRKIVVDAMRETGGTWWNEKKSRKKRVGSVAANLDSLENNKEPEGGAQGTQASCKNCTS